MKQQHRNDGDDPNDDSSAVAVVTSCIVVARHGERLDYYIRDHPYEMMDANNGIPTNNWCTTAVHPYDPPLTHHGTQQAQVLGSNLVQVLDELHLPPIGEIYTSPFLRCRQTAANIRRGALTQQQKQQQADRKEDTIDPTKTTSTVATVAATTASSSPPIRVEIGLMESIHEDWYRSWAIIPGSDGTWGYGYSYDYNKETIHEMAKIPIQVILSSMLQNMMMDYEIDTSYMSKTNITESYNMFNDHYETDEQQRDRMKQVIDIVTSSAPATTTKCTTATQTIVFVSHGGPIVHLYQSLTSDKNVYVHHGEASYCSYSIYIQQEPSPNRLDDNDDTSREKEWHAIRVNQSKHIRDMERRK